LLLCIFGSDVFNGGVFVNKEVIVCRGKPQG